MKVIRLLLGLLLFSLALTILYLSMRAVLGVGGYCAEGGAYVIETHCPQGTAFLTPLSIFAMMAGGGLYLASLIEKAPQWGFFFWTALFVSLGWNFLDFALWQGEAGAIEYGWLFCAVVFAIMGLAPVLLMGWKNFKNMLLGESFPDSAGMLLGHLLAAGGGVWAGMAIFVYFS